MFALGGESSALPRPRLLEVLDDAFVAFKVRQRAMQDAETCLCNACQKIWMLDLKMVVHHGAFLRHTVGGQNRVAGTAVILVHRLLKNGLARTGGYALLTEPVLRSLGIDSAEAGLLAHTEHYEYLGDVRCFVRELDLPSPCPLPGGERVSSHPQAIA